jgi:hypothetical protein
MDVAKYLDLKERLVGVGFAEEITWAENIKECTGPEAFALEHAFVVCNSGMKAQVAGRIFKRVAAALKAGEDPVTVFGHKGKCAAIAAVWRDRERLFGEWSTTENKLEYLETLPFIGGIVKYHLAKNLGHDCCKPDRHLVRVAGEYGKTPEDLCEALKEATGDNLATVDTVIWRSCNLGFL